MASDDSLTPSQIRLYLARMASWERKPTFLLGMIVAAGEEELARITLDHLAKQIYPDFALVVISDAEFPGFRVSAAGTDPMQALNLALGESDADWVGMLRPGDLIPHHAFLLLAESVCSHPSWCLVYSDEDAITPAGEHVSPHFKPDFNLDLLRSKPYIGGLTLAKRSLFADSEGFDDSGAAALAFRAYETAGEAGIGHVAEILHHRLETGVPFPAAAALGALAGHLERSGIPARIESGMLPGAFRVRYLHPSQPTISIVIPVLAPFSRLQACLESIVEKTIYPNYELLLSDMGSHSPEIRTYLDSLANLNSAKIRVLPPSSGLGDLFDQATRCAKGDHVLILDSRTAVLQPDWLDALMEHGQRIEVGAVGARLIDSQGKIHSAGLVPCTSPIFQGLPMNNPGYFGRLQVEQDYSAVSGKCLLIKKALLEAWLSEPEKCLDGFFDVDLCLSVRKKGLLVVWTPYANLLYTESAADSGETLEGLHLLWKKWLPNIANDPAYNKNLSVERAFEREIHAELFQNPLPWRPIPRVLCVIGDSKGGSGEYRAKAPLRALNDAGRIEGMECHVHHTPVGMESIKPDAVLLQYQIEEAHILATEINRQYSDAFYVFEIDDLVTNLSANNANKFLFPPDTVKRLRKIASLVDRMVVSTKPLAQAYKGYCRDIRVVPNYIERAKWGHLQPQRRQGKLPRVGWAGSNSHGGDLAFMVDVVKALSDEVEWVFFGMCPESLKPFVEYHAPVPIADYPDKLASLNLDLAVAPLEIHPFNEAKSHLKLLEYGILGYPVICTDFTPYQGEYPVTRLKNRFQEWVKAIRKHAADLDECTRRGDALRNHVLQHWILEDNLDVWAAAWLP